MGGVRRKKGPNPGSLGSIKKRVKDLGVQSAASIARQASPELTSRARSDYNSGRTAYGEPRPRGKYGPLTLVDTGDTLRYLRFVSVGSTTRVALGTSYAKYLIGKYKILPSGSVPTAWSQALKRIAKRVLDANWSRSKAA